VQALNTLPHHLHPHLKENKIWEFLNLTVKKVKKRETRLKDKNALEIY
jgi:hypothetical protein